MSWLFANLASCPQTPKPDALQARTLLRDLAGRSIEHDGEMGGLEACCPIADELQDGRQHRGGVPVCHRRRLGAAQGQQLRQCHRRQRRCQQNLWRGGQRHALRGGTGKDVFVFDTRTNKRTNVDKISDFRYQDDSFFLENKIFTKLGSGTGSKPKKFTWCRHRRTGCCGRFRRKECLIRRPHCHRA